MSPSITQKTKTLTAVLLPFLIFLATNSLFIIKYLGRLTSFYPIGVIVYILLLSLTVAAFSLKKTDKFFRSKYTYGFGVLVTLAGVLLLQHFIDPYLIQVDRWSAIHNFLSYLLEGKYPYAAQTHLGGYGSPFPVWQLFHLPFYLLGDVGYSIVFILLIFAHVLSKVFGQTTATKIWVLLALSPSFWYEIAVRSDLMGNFILCLSAICWLYYKRKTFSEHILLWSIICAAFLSTRISTAIPFALLLFLPFLHVSWKKRLGFIFGTLGIFALTFFPFFLWDGNMLFFFEYNPFVLQTRQGAWQDYVLMAAICLFFACTWKCDFVKWMSHTSYTLFLLVVVTFLFLGINKHSFHLNYDITYFNMSLPFCIASIACIVDKKKLACHL